MSGGEALGLGLALLALMIVLVSLRGTSAAMVLSLLSTKWIVLFRGSASETRSIEQVCEAAGIATRTELAKDGNLVVKVEQERAYEARKLLPPGKS